MRAPPASAVHACRASHSIRRFAIRGHFKMLEQRAGGTAPSGAQAVELKRWAVLMAYNWIGFSQGMVWVTYSASAPEAKELYGAQAMNGATVNLLLNWGPITYLLGIWFIMWLLNRGGRCVYHCMLLAGWLTAAGSVMRCLPALLPSLCGTRPMLWVHAGQICNGFSGPAVGGSCSAVAAAWFAPSERTLATSIAYGVCALGPAVGFVAATFVKCTADFELLLYQEAAWSVAGAVLWTIMPALPAIPPSKSAQQQQGGGKQRRGTDQSTPLGLIEECRRVCSDHSFCRLVIAGGASFGVFQCWAASLPNVMPICPVDKQQHDELQAAHQSGDCMSESLVQQLGTAGNFGIWLGTLVVGPVAERWFHCRLKRLLVLLFQAQIVLFAGLTLSLPVFGSPAPLSNASAGRLLFLVGSAAACLGATSPLFIELGAEISYPASEGISAGLVSATINLAGLVLLVWLDHVPSDWLSAMVTLVTMLCAALFGPVREEYIRTDFDEGHVRKA